MSKDDAPSPALPVLSLRAAGLSHRKPTRFALDPDAAGRAAMAAELGLLSLSRLSFRGELTPVGRADFDLTADLQAEVEQPCSVTLAPVPARIAEKVHRRLAADQATPEGDEVEVTDDETDPLPEVIDLTAMALEALSLALPPYPRAPGAELGEAVFAAPGVAPLKEADLRPFAGLAGLADKLRGGGSEGG